MFLPFASHLSFLDPQFDEDGNPYGPTRFNEIVKDCWFISKNIHTSYNEVLLISPTERDLLIKYIIDDIKEHNKKLQEAFSKDKKLINN